MTKTDSNTKRGYDPGTPTTPRQTGPNTWAIDSFKSDTSYVVVVTSTETRCSCPHWTSRIAPLASEGALCKHGVAVHAAIAAQPKPTKSAAEYQAAADERFARQQAEQAIAAQNQRYEEAREAARHALPSLVRDVPLTDAEAERVTALERAARKAKRLKDEELRTYAAQRNGTAAGCACLLELAARQIAWAKDAELKAHIHSIIDEDAPRPAVGTSVKVWGPGAAAEAMWS